MKHQPTFKRRMHTDGLSAAGDGRGIFLDFFGMLNPLAPAHLSPITGIEAGTNYPQALAIDIP